MEYLFEFFKFLAVAIPIIGLIYAGMLRLLKDVSTFTSHIAEIRETVRITNVAIEAMRMVDSDIVIRIESNERRISDLENYLSLMTSKDKLEHPRHPFSRRGRH